MSLPHRAPRARGFTLVEVMVALVVICVGLLGIASMQGLALSSASSARQRSLAAIEAASLAASMHTNRVFWLNNAGSDTITVKATTVTDPAGKVTLGKNCYLAGASTTAQCNPQQMAGYDLQNWANAVNALLPNPVSTVTCGTTVPLSCTIDIKWVEQAVAANKQEAAAASTAAGFENTEYVLYVEP
jgi:type IV pilus assembly protein PilV